MNRSDRAKESYQYGCDRTLETTHTKKQGESNRGLCHGLKHCNIREMKSKTPNY